LVYQGRYSAAAHGA
jgi:hypothetical protein